MQIDDILLLRMNRQYLFAPAEDELTVLRDLCGLQSQFYGNCLHALRLRCGKAPDEDILRTSAVKTWTLRGTLHLIALDDLPLFLYDGRSHFLRPCDTMSDDGRLSAARKRELAAIILDAAKKGCGDREELRLLCRGHGMTDDEEQSAFEPWGGLLRALCESGVLCHTAQQKKAFRPCPPFAPMTKADALRALMRRYLTHYGPVTVQDAAYFFGLPQRELLPVIESLSPQEFICEGKTFYSLGDINITSDLSCCRFLAGFDSLMLGYEKRSNPFLPEEALRGVFTLATIRSLSAKKCMRTFRLGAEYDKEALQDRLLENQRDIRVTRRYFEFMRPYTREYARKNPPTEKYYRQRDFYLHLPRVTGYLSFFRCVAIVLGVAPLYEKEYRQPLSAECREACRRLDRFTAEITLVCREHLDTPEDVQRFLARMDKEMDAISAARSKIRNKQRGCADPVERVELKKSCAACTAELSRLRKQKQTAYNMIEDNPRLKDLLACELDAWVENDPYLSPREKQALRNQRLSQEEKTIMR